MSRRRHLSYLFACGVGACWTPEVMIARERAGGEANLPPPATCQGTTGAAGATGGAGGKVCGTLGGMTGSANTGGWGGACASACAECVLQGRPDVLSHFAAQGWNTSCSNWDQILANWCATTMDYVGCALEKAARCSNACDCGTACTKCVIAQGPTTLRSALQAAQMVVCDNAEALVASWCSGDAGTADPTACAELEQGVCCPVCP